MVMMITMTAIINVNIREASVEEEYHERGKVGGGMINDTLLAFRQVNFRASMRWKCTLPGMYLRDTEFARYTRE